MKTGVNQHNYKAGFIKFLVPVIRYLAFETAGNATETENKVYKSSLNNYYLYLLNTNANSERINALERVYIR